MDSPKFGDTAVDSSLDGEDLRSEPAVPDLSFLSANFSSESLVAEPSSASAGASAMSTPAPFSIPTPFSSAANLIGPGTASQASKRYSCDNPLAASYSSLNSPSAPVGQPSFSFHQRANSNSSGPRRPRSLLMSDSAANAIWEHAEGAAGALERPANRNSFHALPRAYNPPYLPPPNPKPTSKPESSRRDRSPTGSPVRSHSPSRRPSSSPYRLRNGSPLKSLPFNFHPQDINLNLSNNPSLVVKPAHRKGHRYKHSSVSMNLFQEPVAMAESSQSSNLIPEQYPIPNFKESLNSASASQKSKVALSVAHFSVSVLIFITGVKVKQPAFSTLAHLIFYDSLGSFLVACVDIMSNFEVWGKSSLAYPFGLGRLEVLAGFALSTSLVMVGCDLVSHFVEEMVVGLVDSSTAENAEHGAHHIHGSDHGPINWLLYELMLLIVISVTWFTSLYIFEDTAIFHLMKQSDQKPSKKGKTNAHASRGGLLNSLESNENLMTRAKSFCTVLVKNPIRLLTLTYSFFLLTVPFIPEHYKESFGFDLNEASTLVVASTLCYAGWNLVNNLGGILLISFPYSDYDYTVLKASIYDKIQNLQCFKASYAIGDLYFCKLKPQLYIAGVSVSMKGSSPDDELRLIFEVNRTVANMIKDFDSGCVVETTISVERV